MAIFMDQLLLGQKLPEITSLLLKKSLQNNQTSFTQKEVVLGKRKNQIPHSILSKSCVYKVFIQPNPTESTRELGA